MSWMKGIGARWRLLFARPAAEERMDEEMRFHLEMETEKNIREGMSREEARRRALIAFGGVEKHKERMRDGRRIPLLENLVQDTRYAVRSLRRTPGFTLTVVLTLAVGIGAATAMYGVMSRLLLLPPPHVAEPERVVKPYFTYREPGQEPFTVSGRDYQFFEALRSGTRTLAAVSTYTDMKVGVGEGADAAEAEAAAVGPGFWTTLGTRPALGRFFSDPEASPVDGSRVAVLGHAFWRQRFGGDPAIIGKTIRIKGHSYEVIGVAPRGFRGIELSEVDLWLPLMSYGEGTRDSLTWAAGHHGSYLTFVGRLKPGVTAARAGTELTSILLAYEEALRRAGRPPSSAEGTRIFATAGPVVGALGGNMKAVPEARVSVWLVGIAAVLLGAACVNVASLLLLRAMRRRREIAVRIALGMGRARMAAQLFVESLLLATVGGIVALAVALGGGSWINRVLLPDLAWEPDGVDWRMLSLTAGCVLGTALLAGLAPLLQTRSDPAAALREGSQQGGSARLGLLRILLVTQISLSVVLLVGAGLFLRSLQTIDALDLGLDRDNVQVVTIDFTGTGTGDQAVMAFWERALERVRALPGVERASLTATTPLRGARGGGLDFPTAPGVPKWEESPYVYYVTPDFFATTGTSFLMGRDFLPSERSGRHVVVINETIARRGWPGRSPIGECVPRRGEKACATIVGVVENARRFSLREGEYLLNYQPLDPQEVDSRVLLVRVSKGAELKLLTLRRALLEIEPNLPYLHMEPLGAPLDAQIRPWRLGASVFTAFGVLAAVLAAVGLYSALAYAIAQRTREIGIRLAIGANATDMVKLVMRDSLRLALVGIVLGLGASLVGGRWIGDLLFEVSPRDWRVLASAGASLLVVALLASTGPARRAMRVDPAVAMRVD
jgi:putative ABC transport system permease protein